MMRNWLWTVAAVMVTIPGLTLELGLYKVPRPPLRALIFGGAIVGAAFLLSWAAEVLQLEVSQGLALGLLALVAVLPEYIVDATFAWRAAEQPVYAEYVVANMTGANRILIGVAWPLVILISWLRWRRRSIEFEPEQRLALMVLLLATLYAVVIPLKGNLSLIDLVVLGGLFVAYMWRLSKQPASPPRLFGPAETVGALSTVPRRVTTIGFGVAAAIVVIVVAESFADALIATGTELGVNEFLIVQWLAPLASETPEFVVVSILAWQGTADASMGALISSKINQWTLLVGTLPLVYAISLGAIAPLPLNDRQGEELLLTAAQTLFAVLIVLDLRLHWYAAIVLFGLFVAGFVWPTQHVALAIVYVGLGLVAAVYRRREVGPLVRQVRELVRPSP